MAKLVAPHPNTLDLVNSWLEHHGVSSSSISMTHGGNTLMLKSVSLAQANTLLNASYQLYKHVERSETIVRTVGYALPAALHGHVLTVVPTTSFVSPPTQWQPPRNRSGGAAAGLVKSASGGPATVLSSREDVNFLTPEVLRRRYDTYAYTATAVDRNMVGIVGMLGDSPSPADLAAFMRKYRSEAADATFTVVPVNGGVYDPTNPHEEANLDTQYALAIAYPTPHIFYSTGRGPSGNDDWFVSWLEYIIGQPNIPQTISISYSVEEKFVSKEDAVYVCRLFAQLGARGVSVLVTSGDHGVGEDCVTNDGSVRFAPRFPGTCTCGVFSWIAASIQVQVQDAHYIATLLQVPLSPSSAERQASSRRSQRISPEVASRTTLSAQTTRTWSCPPSSRTLAAGIMAFTSEFASLT